MTVSRKLALTLTALSLSALAGCADVGSGTAADEEFPVVRSTDQDVIICQSIRVAIQRDQKAAAEARAAGNEAQVKAKQEAVQSGVVAAGTVKACDVSDLVPGSAQPSAAGAATAATASGAPSPG